jgi:hypothetical protein
MSRRPCIALIALLTLFAAVRVASTHRLFGGTFDEPVHLAAGWQWLGGKYAMDLGHPPLARMLAALPLRFAGLPDPPAIDDVEQGNFLLYYGDRYLKHLARMRSGNLLLLILAILALAAQAHRSFGRGTAVLATAIFTTLPPILAHAGVATTDMAVTAALPVSLLALDRFLERQSIWRAAAAGAAIALGVLAKFSFFVYFPAAALVLLAVRRPPRPRARAIGTLALTAFLGTWAGYQFHFGKMGDVFYGAAFFAEYSAPAPLQKASRWFSEHVPVPAPELAVGMAVLRMHDKEGHLAYLFGERSQFGWWYYFPVVFFFKTPLPFLMLAFMGIVLALRRREGLDHALVPLAILLVAMTASINIGVRHVLPMYAPLSIVAAVATRDLWRRAETRPFAKLGLVALLTWLFVGSAAAHPDYLGWFNEAAGPHPERIAVDSNLDWGQDVLRLERVVRELKIEKLYIEYATSARLEHHPIPALPLPGHPVSGWIAVGESPLALWPENFQWLTRYEPVRKVGSSIRLYYIPPSHDG